MAKGDSAAKLAKIANNKRIIADRVAALNNAKSKKAERQAKAAEKNAKQAERRKTKRQYRSMMSAFGGLGLEEKEPPKKRVRTKPFRKAPKPEGSVSAEAGSDRDEFVLRTAPAPALAPAPAPVVEEEL